MNIDAKTPLTGNPVPDVTGRRFIQLTKRARIALQTFVKTGYGRTHGCSADRKFSSDLVGIQNL